MTCYMYMLCVRCFVKYCVRNLLKMLTVANGRTLFKYLIKLIQSVID